MGRFKNYDEPANEEPRHAIALYCKHLLSVSVNHQIVGFIGRPRVASCQLPLSRERKRERDPPPLAVEETRRENRRRRGRPPARGPVCVSCPATSSDLRTVVPSSRRRGRGSATRALGGTVATLPFYAIHRVTPRQGPHAPRCLFARTVARRLALPLAVGLTATTTTPPPPPPLASSARPTDRRQQQPHVQREVGAACAPAR